MPAQQTAPFAVVSGADFEGQQKLERLVPLASTAAVGRGAH